MSGSEYLEESDDALQEWLRGSVDVLRCWQSYDLGIGPLALAHAQSALHRLPPDHMGERGLVMIILALSLQMGGDLQQAYEVIYKEIA